MVGRPVEGLGVVWLTVVRFVIPNTKQIESRMLLLPDPFLLSERERWLVLA